MALSSVTVVSPLTLVKLQKRAEKKYIYSFPGFHQKSVASFLPLDLKWTKSRLFKWCVVLGGRKLQLFEIMYVVRGLNKLPVGSNSVL